MHSLKPLLLAAACLTSTLASATVRLPKLVGDNMVLQRDTKLPLWGWAAPGETVTVTFRGKTYPAKAAGADGKWTVTLPPTAAGGPFEMTVQGSNTLTIRDILVGDVWVAGGQSNMEFRLQDKVDNHEQEIATANYPQIRLLDVQNKVAYQPQAEFESAGWLVCSPQTVGTFSAVAYFFARDLHQRYHVPIGLIATNWSSSPAEAWMSAPVLKTFPEFQPLVTTLEQTPGGYAQATAEHAEKMRAWQKLLISQDQGYPAGGPSWASAAASPQGWGTMTLPGLWEKSTAELREFDGVVWLRKELTLPPEAAGQPLTLALGQIDDNDSTWFNGVKVGSTTGNQHPRRYIVPAALVKAGRNVITVRVFDASGGGGFVGPPETLQAETGTSRVPLAGDWLYQVGLDVKKLPAKPAAPSGYKGPLALYNGMIAPLLPYAIKGVIWYQGEANATRAGQYRTLFPALITDWRQRWGQGDFPFLFVQLANYMPDQPQPADYEWAELREAQAQTLRLPNTGMAVAIDLGNVHDIHPHNKQDVGTRLALAARRVAYKETQLVHAGPTYQALTVQGPQARLAFTNIGGGLVLKDPAGPLLKGFALAGADRKFYWAQGKLDGNTLVLSSPDVPKPVAVRYDWGNSPFPNLYNKEGLPAVPFRTDSWPGFVANRK